MTFNLSVSGYAPNEEVEHRLVEALHAILSDPAISVQSSTFRGLWHEAQPIHLPVAVENVQGVPVQLATELPSPELAGKLENAINEDDPDTEPPAAGEQQPAEAVDETNVAA